MAKSESHQQIWVEFGLCLCSIQLAYFLFSFCIRKNLFLLSNESLCDGPTNGPAGRSPHFYSCFYDLNGMKLLFLWLLTSSQRFLFICFINQETFVSPQQQRNFSEMFLLFKIHNISNPKRIMIYPSQNVFFLVELKLTEMKCMFSIS